jgi:hypothetical protein
MQYPLHDATIPTTAPRRKNLVESIHYACSVDAGRYVLVGTAPEEDGGYVNFAEGEGAEGGGGVYAEEAVVAAVRGETVVGKGVGR